MLVKGLTGSSWLFGLIGSVPIQLSLPAMLTLLVMWFLLPQIEKELGCWFLLIKKENYKLSFRQDNVLHYTKLIILSSKDSLN